MKKAPDKPAQSEMRPEYDFSRGVRGKYARRHAEGANVMTIRRLRGILKRKPGERPFAEEMSKHKREEKTLEKGKYARSTGSR
jgi:hypothetical protein